MPVKPPVAPDANKQRSESSQNINADVLLAVKLKPAKPIDRKQTKTLFDLLRDRLEPRRSALQPNDVQRDTDSNISASSPSTTQPVASNGGAAVIVVPRQTTAADVEGSEIDVDTRTTPSPMS